jgi:hypothetical protein
MQQRQREIRGQALWCLTHPISLLAVVGLLINDHWWRWHYPSWWTGKMGDFAWLIFAPFLLLILLSFVPRLGEKWGIGLAFGLVGGGFALAKTIPFFHKIAVWILYILSGWQPSLRRDPTDLLALLGLGVAWWLWGHSAGKQTHFKLKTVGWTTIALGLLGTIASSPAHPRGIICVYQQENDNLLAYSTYDLDTFKSEDGGFTWSDTDFYEIYETEGVPRNAGTACPNRTIGWELVDPRNPMQKFRHLGGTLSIEVMKSDNSDWLVDYAVSNAQEIRHAYYRNDLSIVPIDDSLLFNDVMVYEPTQTIIVSMGAEGILLRTAEGEWQPVQVGQYQHVDTTNMKGFRFLTGQVMATTILAWLLFVTFAILGHFGLVMGRKLYYFQIAILLFGWWFWYNDGMFFSLITLENFTPDLVVTNLVINIGIVGIALFIGNRGSSAITHLKGFRRIVFSTILGACLLFFLPYLFWANGTIPTLDDAFGYSFWGILVVVVPAFFHTIRMRLNARA